MRENVHPLGTYNFTTLDSFESWAAAMSKKRVLPTLDIRKYMSSDFYSSDRGYQFSTIWHTAYRKLIIIAISNFNLFSSYVMFHTSLHELRTVWDEHGRIWCVTANFGPRVDLLFSQLVANAGRIFIDDVCERGLPSERYTPWTTRTEFQIQLSSLCAYARLKTMYYEGIRLVTNQRRKEQTREQHSF